MIKNSLMPIQYNHSYLTADPHGTGRKMVCSLRMLIEVVYIIYNIRKAQEYNKQGD